MRGLRRFDEWWRPSQRSLGPTKTESSPAPNTDATQSWNRDFDEGWTLAEYLQSHHTHEPIPAGWISPSGGAFAGGAFGLHAFLPGSQVIPEGHPECWRGRVVRIEDGKALLDIEALWLNETTNGKGLWRKLTPPVRARVLVKGLEAAA